MFSKHETYVGHVAKRRPSTRISNPAGGRQSFNIFSVQTENDGAEENNNKDSNVHHSSTRRIAPAPGGKSSMASVLSHDSEPVKEAQVVSKPVAKNNIFSMSPAPERVRSSTRVHACPGGASNMGAILGHSAEAEPVAPVLSRAEGPADNAMGQVLEHHCPPDQPRGFKTARVNESKNVLALTPVRQAPQTARTGRVNESKHILALTPEAPKPTTTRTARMNQESVQASPQVSRGRYAARNKQRSSVFAFGAEEEQPVRRKSRSSTRRMAPPGGFTSNIFG